MQKFISVPTIKNSLFPDMEDLILDPFPANQWADRAVEEARNWLGVPFRHAGRDKLGIDCVGLPIKILHFLGLTNWDDIAYSRSVVPERMRQEIELFCCKIEEGMDKAQRADLLWFNICGATQHVGIYTGKENTVIHAYESAGKVVEHRLDEKWRVRVEAVYRFVKVVE